MILLVRGTSDFLPHSSEGKLVLVPGLHRVLLRSFFPQSKRAYFQPFSSQPFHVALLMHPRLWFVSVFSSSAPQAVLISTKSWLVTLATLSAMKTPSGEENECPGLKQIEIHMGML